MTLVYIEKCTNNGTQYLRLVESYRSPNSKGIKVAKKKLIYNIGPLSRYDDGKPDYISRLKESFKSGSPIIESLKPFCSKKQPLEHYSLEYTR